MGLVSAPERPPAGGAAVPAPSAAPAAPDTLTIPRERLAHDWRRAHTRAERYLQGLDVGEAEAAALARAAVERAATAARWEPGATAIGETLRALGAIVAAETPSAAERPVGDRFLAWRLARALGRTGPGGAWRGERFSSAPPLVRRPLLPGHLERRQRRPRRTPDTPPVFGPAARDRRRQIGWTRVAYRRRTLLGLLVLLPTIVASGIMANLLPGLGVRGLEVTIVVVFGALFGWISIGFWTATIGFFLLLTRRDRFAITQLARDDGARLAAGLPPGARTALLMPIAAEPVERVFAGLRAMERSLARIGALEHFDFFVLSDTRDPTIAAAEEAAWLAWARASGGFDRIFYRRRRVPLRRKSGNVADFFRRWGAAYRYVVMLDADSVMAGETLVRLVHLMERQPEAGMIQTAPVAVNRRSLLARTQQFAARIYGPMFAAGLHYWQLGDGQYWGHNAIIRAAPFMAYCGLPRLSGKPPFGGEILSHDFVEAALMGRAGWTLWLAYDLDGTYEEVPSTLLEEMKRDRRWCQGNLQHLRLLFAQGLFGAHRALFLNGVLSYVSAVLWFLFLTLCTAEAIRVALLEPVYFPDGPSLFPSWPVWHPDWALALLGATAAVLFLPKLLALLLITFRRRTRAFGGGARLLASALLEVVLSSLLAPVRMTFHTRFVLANLLGRTVPWRSQGREDEGTSWREAVAHHGFDTAWATAWGVSLFLLNPDYFFWVTPIVGALVLSIPVSVLTSRAAAGDRARAAGLFLIPEEVSPPPELRDLAALQEDAHRTGPGRERDAFVRAVADPVPYAVHRALLAGERSFTPALRGTRDALVARALAEGPGALGARERAVVLADPRALDELHRRVWADPDPARAVRWLDAGAA